MKTWLLCALAGALAWPILVNVWVVLTEHEVYGYVTSTDRDGDRKFVYLDEHPGMLYNDDNWWVFKTNSGTIQGQIPEKADCRFHVYGVRFPLLSMAPNILVADCERS